MSSPRHRVPRPPPPREGHEGGTLLTHGKINRLLMESDSDDPDNELEQFEMDSDSDIYESVSEGALGGERRGSSLAITTSRRPQISSPNIPHK